MTHRYPTSVATLSRRARDIIEAGFVRSVDEVCATGASCSAVACRSNNQGQIIRQQLGSTRRLNPGGLQGTASLLLGSRLHDFGFRGCTCVEQSIIGGCAHLLNFDGTDTMAAAYYAQVGCGLEACSQMPRLLGKRNAINVYDWHGHDVIRIAWMSSDASIECSLSSMAGFQSPAAYQQQSTAS